jgi:hypothetical protein
MKAASGGTVVHVFIVPCNAKGRRRKRVADRMKLFRLHPLGPRKMSTGGIVLNKVDDFARLRKDLLSAPLTVTSSGMHAYGMISVASLAPDSKGASRKPMDVA